MEELTRSLSRVLSVVVKLAGNALAGAAGQAMRVAERRRRQHQQAGRAVAVVANSHNATEIERRNAISMLFVAAETMATTATTRDQPANR